MSELNVFAIRGISVQCNKHLIRHLDAVENREGGFKNTTWRPISHTTSDAEEDSSNLCVIGDYCDDGTFVHDEDNDDGDCVRVEKESKRRDREIIKMILADYPLDVFCKRDQNKLKRVIGLRTFVFAELA